MGDTNALVVKEMCAGLIAGGANIASGFPFDTVKVRLQAERGVYRGAWQCFRHILKFDGIRGLYRGLTPPLIGGALETGINYLVYRRVLSLLQDGKPADQPPLHFVPIAAGSAGIFLSVVLGPTELVKCRMQVAGGSRYNGPMHCLQRCYETEGLRGLTRGMHATMAREVPGNAIFFTIYEAMRQTLPGRRKAGEEDGGVLGLAGDATSAVFCGGVAGTAMWAMVLPIDVAKTRLQTAFPGTRHDVGMIQHYKMLWREGRWKALYSGLTPTLIRAFPANATQWVTWELAIEQLSKLDF
ncbi:hypothetical protein BSKO_11120 [Bryopsis sp. KO-2023]|nr:hypothetical protein BSKO_11120 [Bryopsis sp. KO-2023]